MFTDVSDVVLPTAPLKAVTPAVLTVRLKPPSMVEPKLTSPPPVGGCEEGRLERGATGVGDLQNPTAKVAQRGPGAAAGQLDEKIGGGGAAHIDRGQPRVVDLVGVGACPGRQRSCLKNWPGTSTKPRSTSSLPMTEHSAARHKRRG
jgi:hypothetical protein